MSFCSKSKGRINGVFIIIYRERPAVAASAKTAKAAAANFL